jgi:hypothetical protein
MSARRRPPSLDVLAMLITSTEWVGKRSGDPVPGALERTRLFASVVSGGIDEHGDLWPHHGEDVES